MATIHHQNKRNSIFRIINRSSYYCLKKKSVIDTLKSPYMRNLSINNNLSDLIPNTQVNSLTNTDVRLRNLIRFIMNEKLFWSVDLSCSTKVVNFDLQYHNRMYKTRKEYVSLVILSGTMRSNYYYPEASFLIWLTNYNSWCMPLSVDHHVNGWI